MKRNPWPYAIIAYFVLFISGIVTWVVFAVRHDDQLVRPDYYEHEMTYQKQIDRVNRTAPIRSEVNVRYVAASQTVVVDLPASTNADEVNGKVHFYRPSNAKLDREVPLALDSRGSQMIDVSKMNGGLWKVHLNWSRAGQEYYFEKPLVLDTE